MDELISRQAAIDEMEEYWLSMNLRRRRIPLAAEAVYMDLKGVVATLPSAEPQRWIPVKTRPMDEEERAYWSDHLGYDFEYEDAVMFDCKMPDDGQEILVSFGEWVNMDKCEIDGGLYGLEGNGDWDGVTAWMPLPEPYCGEEMQSTMGQLNDDAQSTKGGDDE